jgi:hypothetical protein
MLERTRLRTDVITRLKGNTSAGDNVFDSRVTGLSKEKLPALNITTPAESGTSDRATTYPDFETELTLEITVHISQADGWAGELDNLCEEVVSLLLTAPDFVDKYSRIASYRTEVIASDGGENPLIVAAIRIGLYYHEYFEPVIGDDLATVHIDVDAIDPSDPNLSSRGPDEVIEASIDVILETGDQ